MSRQFQFSFPVSLSPDQIFTFTFQGHAQTSISQSDIHILPSSFSPTTISYDCFCFLVILLFRSLQTSCFMHKCSFQLTQNTTLSLFKFLQRATVFCNRPYSKKSRYYIAIDIPNFAFPKNVSLRYMRPQVLHRKGRLPTCLQDFSGLFVFGLIRKLILRFSIYLFPM